MVDAADVDYKPVLLDRIYEIHISWMSLRGAEKVMGSKTYKAIALIFLPIFSLIYISVGISHQLYQKAFSLGMITKIN